MRSLHKGVSDQEDKDSGSGRGTRSLHKGQEEKDSGSGHGTRSSNKCQTKDSGKSKC